MTTKGEQLASTEYTVTDHFIRLPDVTGCRHQLEEPARLISVTTTWSFAAGCEPELVLILSYRTAEGTVASTILVAEGVCLLMSHIAIATVMQSGKGVVGSTTNNHTH